MEEDGGEVGGGGGTGGRIVGRMDRLKEVGVGVIGGEGGEDHQGGGEEDLVAVGGEGDLLVVEAEDLLVVEAEEVEEEEVGGEDKLLTICSVCD